MSLHEAVRGFIVDRLASSSGRLTVPAITDAYIRAQVDAGSWMVGPDDQRSAEYIGVAQLVREKLRAIVPENPEPKGDSEQIEALPESELLQERYSVRGEGDETYYVLRSELDESEMLQITARFRALSRHFTRHAKALEADWNRTHEMVEV